MKSHFLESPITVHAPGKAILVGEHAAVYGYPAVAVALPDIQLQLRIEPAPLQNDSLTTWTEAFEFYVRGTVWNVSLRQRDRLLKAFTMALEDSGFVENLENFLPARIVVRSDIPLGAGMGGSAALSTAFVKLADALCGKTTVSHTDLAERANRIDSLFHGKASGLDVNAIAANGVIKFVKDEGVTPVSFKRPFHLMLVDTGERGETARMVELVGERRRANKQKIDSHLEKLGELSALTIRCLEEGNLASLGECLNVAHEHLIQLGVSTRRLDAIAVQLREMGALGAKLTGAGGGGLVLGLFAENPLRSLSIPPGLGDTYVTSVVPVSPS